MMLGFLVIRAGSHSKKAFACGVATCADPASESLNDSTIVNLFLTSRLSEHSNEMLPGSAFTSAVYFAMPGSHSSRFSGRISTWRQMKITEIGSFAHRGSATLAVRADGSGSGCGPGMTDFPH